VDFEVDQVKCGVVNAFGNKGAIAVRLFVEQTSICILNVHLPAGWKNGKRFKAIQQIFAKMFWKNSLGKCKMNSILDSDYMIIAGDTNFWIEMNPEEVLSWIQRINPD